MIRNIKPGGMYWETWTAKQPRFVLSSSQGNCHTFSSAPIQKRERIYWSKIQPSTNQARRRW
jgi:hypothetical protein